MRRAQKQPPPQTEFGIAALDLRNGMLEVCILKHGSLEIMRKAPSFSEDMKLAFGKLIQLDAQERPVSFNRPYVPIMHNFPRHLPVLKETALLHRFVKGLDDAILNTPMACGAVPKFFKEVSSGRSMQNAAEETLLWAKTTGRPVLDVGDEMWRQFTICV